MICFHFLWKLELLGFSKGSCVWVIGRRSVWVGCVCTHWNLIAPLLPKPVCSFICFTSLVSILQEEKNPSWRCHIYGSGLRSSSLQMLLLWLDWTVSACRGAETRAVQMRLFSSPQSHPQLPVYSLCREVCVITENNCNQISNRNQITACVTYNKSKTRKSITR